MKRYKRLARLRRLMLVGLIGTTLATGPCSSLSDFTSTSTVTFSGREIAAYIVNALLLTPLQQALDTGVDRIFDKLEEQEDA